MKEVINIKKLARLLHDNLSNKGLDMRVPEAEIITEQVFEIIKEQLLEGNDVDVLRFGKFSVVETKARKGRNPQTGEEMDIAASKAPKFKYSPKLVKQVKGK